MVNCKKKISFKKFVDDNTCPKMGGIIVLYKYFKKQVKVKCFKEKCHWDNKKRRCILDVLVAEALEKLKKQFKKL
jgi:hypothetical protein